MKESPNSGYLMQGVSTNILHYRKGFTLIELSIVLVIIGLIVGGVLVGRTLVESAEYRAQITQFEQINSAVNAFRLKYNCLPGDCPNATSFFTATTQPEAVTNGNGNGRICGFTVNNACDPADVTSNSAAGFVWGWSEISEFMSVFDHLAAAKLWSGPQYSERATNSDWSGPVTSQNVPGIGYPKIKLNSVGSGVWGGNPITAGQGGIVTGYQHGYGYVKAGHKLRTGYCGNFTCAMNPWQAFALDTKIDDGKALTGSVVVGDENYAFTDPTTGPVYGLCANVDVYRNESNLQSVSGVPMNRACTLIISASF
jgi:prepilin-type N-terminal cleavage/methylation domain-containing protein